MSRSNSKPKDRLLILVTGPDRILKFGWWATRLQLWRVGLRGMYLSPKHETIPANVDGIIIGGGDDINPTHYGATGTAGAVYDERRDKLELEVINLALDTKLPILGICRGAQLINVACGGNLIEDLRPLRKKTPNRNSLFPIKYANIVDQTKLSAVLGKLRIEINSLHNQAVSELGDGLVAVARDDDGFIQAIESTDEQFIIGVQWHPEYMPQRDTQTRLFRALADATQQQRDL